MFIQSDSGGLYWSKGSCVIADFAECRSYVTDKMSDASALWNSLPVLCNQCCQIIWYIAVHMMDFAVTLEVWHIYGM